MAKLILFGPEGPEDYELGEVLTIGRRSNNTLRLLADFVSREHIRITKAKDGYVLEDVSSKDGVGVIVNGVRMKSTNGKRPSHKLRHNDIVLINDIQMAFADPNSDPDYVPTMVPESIREKLKAYEKAKPKPGATEANKNPSLPPASLIRADKAADTNGPEYEPRGSGPKQPAKVGVLSKDGFVIGGTGESGKQANFSTAKNKLSATKNAASAPKQTALASQDMSVSMNASLADYIPHRYLDGQPLADALRQSQKRKLPTVMIVLSVLALAVLAGFALVLFNPMISQKIAQLTKPNTVVADVNQLMKIGKVDEAEALLKDNKERISEADFAALKASVTAQRLVQAVKKIREHLDQNQFEEARRLAQAELSNAPGGAQDEFYMLSDFASSAMNVKKFYENSQGAEKSYDLAALKNIDTNLQDALEEFARNKQKLEDYKKGAAKDGKTQVEPIDMASNSELEKIHMLLVPMKAVVEARITQIQTADKTWSEALEARNAGDWEAELVKLDALMKSPPEVVANATKGQAIDLLLGNLNHFIGGVHAVAKKQYKTAIAEFAQVGKDDPHRAAVDKAMAEVTRKLKIEDALSLHVNGNSVDALTSLNANADDPDAREFRDHISKVLQGWAALKGAQATRVSDQIVKAANSFNAQLDARDAFYKSRVETVLSDIQRNANSLKLARLRQQFDEKIYTTFTPDLEKFIAGLDRNAFPDMYDEAMRLKADSVDLFAEKGTNGFKESSELWQAYQQIKITAADRANIDAATLEKYAKQTKILNDLWQKISEAYKVSVGVKPELRTSIKTLYDQVVAEVIAQSDELFNKVRKAGVIGERPDYVRMAEDRIMMLPAVPNNVSFEQVKAGKK